MLHVKPNFYQTNSSITSGIDVVKDICNRFSVFKDLFKNTYLTDSLCRNDSYENPDQLFNNIQEALTILKEVEPSIAEIQEDMENVKKAFS